MFLFKYKGHTVIFGCIGFQQYLQEDSVYHSALWKLAAAPERASVAARFRFKHMMIVVFTDNP